MAIFKKDKVVTGTFSVNTGYQEIIYKAFCGYLIEAERFMHAIESTHSPVKDLFASDHSIAESIML